LFRTLLAAERPKARSAPSGQNYRVKLCTLRHRSKISD
jgi:hypothetical protein